MLHEIENIHSQITHKQAVRVILARENFDIIIDKTDIIRTTESGMLRIVRANGNITSINPEYIVMTCIINKRSVLL